MQYTQERKDNLSRKVGFESVRTAVAKNNKRLAATVIKDPYCKVKSEPGDCEI